MAGIFDKDCDELIHNGSIYYIEGYCKEFVMPTLHFYSIENTLLRKIADDESFEIVEMKRFRHLRKEYDIINLSSLNEILGDKLCQINHFIKENDFKFLLSFRCCEAKKHGWFGMSIQPKNSSKRIHASPCF